MLSLEKVYDVVSGSIKVPPGKRKIQMVMELVKERIARLVGEGEKTEGSDKRTSKSELLLKSKGKTGRFLEKIKNIYGTSKFDFELLLGILEKVKTENLARRNRGGRKGNLYSINFHAETLLDPMFFHYLGEVKKISSLHKLDFIKIEILEGDGKKPYKPKELDKLGEVVKRLQKEGIKVGLDDYPEGKNNKGLLDDFNKRNVQLNFIKLDGAMIIRFFTNRQKPGDPQTEQELFYRYNNIIEGIIQSGQQLMPVTGKWAVGKKLKGHIEKSGAELIMEGITNENALKWARANFKDKVHLVQGYAIGMKEEI